MFTRCFAVFSIAFGVFTGNAFASEQAHFNRNVASKVKQMSFGNGYQLICAERRRVNHPDDILKTWKPDFAKTARLSASDKKGFAKLMTAGSIASSNNNFVLYRIESDGKAFLSSHCLLAQSKKTAQYFRQNYHAFNEWGRSEVRAAPYKFDVYELRKPFRDSLKRRKDKTKEVYWHIGVHPQQVFVPAD